MPPQRELHNDQRAQAGPFAVTFFHAAVEGALPMRVPAALASVVEGCSVPSAPAQAPIITGLERCAIKARRSFSSSAVSRFIIRTRWPACLSLAESDACAFRKL